MKEHRSISSVLTAMNMVVSGTAIVLACAAFLFYEAASARQALIDEVSTQGQIIASNSISALLFNDEASAANTLSALRASPNIIYAGIYKPEGQFFAGYWRDSRSKGQPLRAPSSGIMDRFTSNDFISTRPIISQGEQVGTVLIQSDLRAVTRRFKTYLGILLSILGLSLLAALLVSRILQRRISKPMIYLADIARRITRDKNYALRAETARNYEEMAVLENAFNDMLAAIHHRDLTLQESEMQFRTMADSLPQLTWIAEADGSITWYNQRWYDYTGTSFEQMAGWGWQSVHDPKLLPEVLKRWKASIVAGAPFEMVFPLRSKDGSFREFLTRATPLKDPKGKVLRWFGTNTDITEQRRIEQALRASERQFRTMANSLPQLAWIAEPDGSRTWFNQRWYDYTGTTFDQVKGWGWESLHDPKFLSAMLETWREATRTAKQWQMVLPLKGKDGVYRQFLTLATPLLDESGNVVRWFGTKTDITDQQRAEAALRNSEKLAATGRLAASIAHEINNPLESVTNLLYLAMKQPDRAQTFVAMADQELERIAEITRHTLGFYRDVSAPVPADVAKLIQDALRLYGRKLKLKQIRVKERYGPGAEVVGFPGELRQVFANVIVNAIEAMSDHGCLSVKVRRGRDWGGDTEGVRVTILDTGSGIDKERMKRIFDAFYTTKQDVGTGLGLWLTQSMVQKHHGRIGVRSRTKGRNRGTVFSIFLPHSAAGVLGPSGVGPETEVSS